MTVALEELRKEMGRMKGHIISQGEELNRLKRATGEDGSHLGSQRLQDIECELGEQKKSTAKITKLCLAAIKALEKLEQRSPGLTPDTVSLDDCSRQPSQDSINRGSSVDPMVVKTMCEQLDVINKLLIKVDDDIEGVDEKAESALADFEQMDRRMTDFDKKLKESRETLMGEVRALLVSRTYATREDVNRIMAQEGPKTQPSGVGLEEVNRLIEKATSNFLRTLQADTASCTERTMDCEELCKRELANLGEKLEATDSFARTEARQIQENTDKNMKEVTRTLASLVEQHRTKTIAENAEAFDRINSRLDTEVKALRDMMGEMKQVRQAGLSEAEEAKLMARVDKIGKEVQGLRADQAKIGQNVESWQTKQTTLENQAKQMSKSLDNYKEEVAKMGKSKEDGPKLEKLEASLHQCTASVTDLKTQAKQMTKNLDNCKEEVTKIGKSKEDGPKLEKLEASLHQCTASVTELKAQTKQITKGLEQQKEEISKSGRSKDDGVKEEKLDQLEASLWDLSQKMESSGRLADTLVLECSRKVDRTELDDIRNGMEKERCKINYFQDKILNIAKVAESARTENTNLKDKLTTEIEGVTYKIEAVNGQVEKFSDSIKDNSEALKGMTKDSIGKIKEVATNCVQIEANIRSIREKSVLFDNELKQIKDKIAQTEYKLENKDQDGAKEVKKMMKDKEEEIRKLSENVEGVKKKVQLNSMELGNFKEDKRTKESENEERQMSLEHNLLDVRTYVERMLQETNRQLTGIASEVESADRKITRCSADIVDILDRQENSSGTSSVALAGLEAQVAELKEQEVMNKVETAGEILELKASLADREASMTTTVEETSTGLATLRKENRMVLDRLESQVSLLSDAGAERERKSGSSLANLKEELEGRVTGLAQRIDTTNANIDTKLKEARAEMKQCTDSMAMGKLHLKVDGLMQAEETRAAQVKTVNEALARVEREQAGHREEDTNKLNKVKEELEGVVRSAEASKKEAEQRVENIRKGIIEMIGANEMKTADIEEQLKQTGDMLRDVKVVQKNNAIIAEDRLKAAKADLENLLNDKSKVNDSSTSDLEKMSAEMRKELDQVKTDLRNNDLESFKNIVNSTNDTHNKLISSIQKNVDVIIREKGALEAQAAALEERVAEIATLRESGQVETLSELATQRESMGRVEEKILSLGLGLRELQTQAETVHSLQTNLANLQDSVLQAKGELGARLETQQTNITNIQDKLNSELKNLKGTGTAQQQHILDEFSEVSRTLQEKSQDTDTRLNESLELLQSHTKLLDSLQDTANSQGTIQESNGASLTKLEFKVSSCLEDLAKLDECAKVSEVRKLEKTISGLPGLTETQAVQGRLAQLSQDTTDSLRELGQKQTSLDTTLATLQTELAKVTDVAGVSEDLTVISSKVNQQKAKLIDLEANVTLQERSNTKLSEDLKKLGGTVTGNLAKVEERLDRMEGTKKELLLKVTDVEKTNTSLSQEVSSLSGLKTKAPTWDRKAETAEVDRLNNIVTEEVNKIQKEIKDILKRTEESQTEAKKGEEVDRGVSSQQVTEINSNYSRLSDVVENLQSRVMSQQELSCEQLETINATIRGLKKGLETLTHESKQSGALGLIDKQRRGWEEAREKAELMSNIFDSLIITNDRPYVSCGLDVAASCPGLIDFNQFELINKVGWDAEALMFTIQEPGVYMMQMGGSLQGASIVAKMVNEDIEAEVVTLEGGPQSGFRSRSTIFTVEDDDQAAERLLIEVVEHGEEEVRLEKDFSFLLYKISEVSQAEGSPDCLQGDFIKS